MSILKPSLIFKLGLICFLLVLSKQVSAHAFHIEWIDNNEQLIISFIELIKQYFWFGLQHILTGYDHLAFLLLLILFGKDRKDLIIIVTSFTLAHSVTLALSVLSIVNIPAPLIEVVIALTIVYVAIENYFIDQIDWLTKWKSQWRWGLTFIFGLLHGFGFSSVLKQIGLPDDRFYTALVSFNVGIEVGQLFIIWLCFKLIMKVKHLPSYQPSKMAISVLLGLLAIYWLIDRLTIL